MPNRFLRESICTSDSVDKLTWFEEVLFYRLIVNCDDFGRFDGRTAVIKNRLFPLKDNLTLKTVETALHGLASAGLVVLYMFEDKRFLYLPTWGKYQTQRAKVSKYPSPDNSIQDDENTCKQMISNVPVFEFDIRNSNSIFDIRNSNDSAEPQAASTPPAICLPLNDGTEYPVSVEQCQEWAGLYPAVDVIQQLRQMKGWLDANPAKRKTKRGVNAFIVRWLAKEQDRGGTAAQRAGKPGYRAQGHNDELDPLERAAVDRLVGQPQRPLKGVEKMQHGVQRHGEELSAFQLAAIDELLKSNGEAAGGVESGE